jgi:hypothetical protein
MRKILLPSIVIALSACGAAYNVDPAQITAVGAEAPPVRDTIIPIIESQIRSRLKDSQSAQFSWPNEFVAGQHQPLMAKPVYGWVTCGTVNARNGFGGYTGPQAVLVVVRNNQVLFMDMDSPSAGRALISGYCRLYGVPV